MKTLKKCKSKDETLRDQNGVKTLKDQRDKIMDKGQSCTYHQNYELGFWLDNDDKKAKFSTRFKLINGHLRFDLKTWFFGSSQTWFWKPKIQAMCYDNVMKDLEICTK